MDLSIATNVLDLERFARDCDRTAAAVDRSCDEAARELSAEGLLEAKRNAKVSSGRRGKRYPSAARRWRFGSGDYFYGPDPSRKQGGMSFEGGSRNQKPHNDYGRSADSLEAKAERVTVRHVDDALGSL